MNDIQKLLNTLQKGVDKMDYLVGEDGLKTDITVKSAPINFAYIFGAGVMSILAGYGIIQLLKK